jgi:hypothetical protein
VARIKKISFLFLTFEDKIGRKELSESSQKCDKMYGKFNRALPNL